MSRALRLAAATFLVAGGIATVGKATPVHAAGCQTTSGTATTACTLDKLSLSSNATRVAPQKTGTATAQDTSTNPPTTVTWTFWEDVYSDPNNIYCSGCLTWIVKVSSAQASTDSIEHVTISNFNGFNADLGYLTDTNGNPAAEPTPPQGVDTTSPALAPGTIIPNSGDRSVKGVLTWDFNSASNPNTIDGGESSVLLEAETNSTTYTAGTVAVIDGVASNQPAYAPALPEFGIVPAFALIGGGAFGARVYRRRRRAAKTAA